MIMRRTTTFILILFAVLLAVAAARGGLSGLIPKIRMIHGDH
jgi:hypothetical protein